VLPKIYVMTSDGYLNILKSYAYLLNKYWLPNPEVVVVGYAAPQFDLPPNFSFISLGNQRDYPVNKWSDGLIKLLNQIDDSHIILMLEDYLITRGVDVDGVRILYDYARQFTYTVRVDLTGDRLYAHGADLTYGAAGRLDLIKSMPGSPYHLSMMTAIWNRELLLKVLVPGESPWDLEIIGTTRLSHEQDMLVIGTRQWPVKHTLAFRGGDTGKLLLDEVNPADVEALRGLGYI
jgi:hypothetical protein